MSGEGKESSWYDQGMRVCNCIRPLIRYVTVRQTHPVLTMTVESCVITGLPVFVGVVMKQLCGQYQSWAHLLCRDKELPRFDATVL